MQARCDGSHRLPSRSLDARKRLLFIGHRAPPTPTITGFTIGAHTLTHPDLTGIPANRLATEVLGSKGVIEDALGTRVDCFAYPYGRHDARSRALVAEHFACACSDALGLVTARSDRFALERVETYYLRSDRRFAIVGTSWLGAALRLVDVPRRLRRAVPSARRPH